MKKMVLILIVIAILLSGCIGGSKSGKAGSNGDEYGTDNSVEQDDSGIVQADYNSLDIHSNDSMVPDAQSTIYANKTINIFDNTTNKKMN
jgi:uncharacterized protein YceK